MPSPAYTTWQTHLVDVQALRQTIAGYGVAPAAEAVVPLTPDQLDALSRSAVVALAAALQAYAVALFEVTAWHLTGSPAAVNRLRMTRVEGSEGHRRFNTPSPDEVRRLFNALFDVLLPGDDIWYGVTAGAMSEQDTRQRVKDHLKLRHTIAHGAGLPIVSPPDVATRVSEFDQIVLALDDRARTLIQSHTGSLPW